MTVRENQRKDKKIRMKKRKGKTMTKDSPDKIRSKAPDGGWGWFVCLGSSLITLSLRSLDPSFGLLFQDLLEELDVDSTGTSLIMSILDAHVNFTGLLVGPLLKNYSYRKIAIFGTLLSCSGLMLTAHAKSMFHIICTYSILGGIGTGLALASSFVALNTYFDKRRGQAVGFSMAGTTLAMMLVPQMIHALLDSYGFSWSLMIFASFALHSTVGACLLRPLKLKEPNKPFVKEVESKSLLNKTDSKTINDNEDVKNSTSASWCAKLMETFDADLLKDSTFINVVIGLSLYYVAESNFKLMTPFFLTSIGMSKGEVAFYLSLTAFTDIIARILLPTIFDRLGYKKRSVFWLSSLLVGICRSVMAELSKGPFLMAIFIVIGFLRGATIVNLNLSVSECCSLKKLPSAFGMFMVSKGIFVVAMSPLIGFIRDYTESYKICIHAMTAIIMVSFLTWSAEFILKSLRKEKLQSSRN